MRICDAVLDLQVPRAATRSGATFGANPDLDWPEARLVFRLGLTGEQSEGQTTCAIKPPCLWKCNRLIAFIVVLAGFLQCLRFGPALPLLAQHVP